MKKLCVLFLLCLVAPALALEVAGIRLADNVHFASRDLQLNGAGVRSILFLDLYVVALYLTGKNTSGAVVLADGGEKRIALHLLRNISAGRLHGGLNNAIADHHTSAELNLMDGQLREFTAIFQKMDEMKIGDVITLDYLPGSGTQVSLNGVFKGTVNGTSFNSALLKIWLGDQPVQADLRQQLLGGR